ncbi:MAG: Ig-like domain-containing protein [Silanimonas sp.]
MPTTVRAPERRVTPGSPRSPRALGLALLALASLAAGPLAAAVQTVADRFVVTENAPALSLRVLANDRIPSAELAGGSLTILRAPTLGTATIDAAGTSTTAADDALVYQPGADRSGEDSLRYRVCGGGNCAEGEVAVVVRPITEAMTLAVTSGSGFQDVAASRVRALPSARFLATPLVDAQVSEFPLAVDATPWLPFSGNAALSLRVLPSAPAARDWRVLVDARSLSSGNVDVYLGIDSNRDGRASADELRCSAGMSATAERCEMAVTVPNCGNVTYWMLVVNAGSAAHTARVETFEVPMDATDGSLVATAPGSIAAGASFPLRVVWDMPQMADTQSRVGYLTVQSAAGATVGSVPVRINRAGRVESGTALASGVERALRLPAGSGHDRLYIDVPAGATSLSVTARASEGIDLYLARIAPPAASAAVPAIGAAPARAAANAASAAASPLQTLTVSGTALSAGRWYVVPVNPSARIADVAVRATIAGTAPLVRPGGYFNTGRSGHGLFLYPAGSEWAGLWYTYLQDGSSTWYYLQGRAPGANGQWRGTVFRSAWDGSRNTLSPVGEAVTTPTGADAFTFSYRLDGQAGSEPFVSFGRGCPTLNGTPLNASSHWFDPARAGTGYSVQLFPDYEFYAAFVYDVAGVPRFLTAERNGFGGATASAPLEQLTGFCPLCTRSAAPTRRPVGTLARTYSNGNLSIMTLDATYAAGVTGRWTGTDAVQALGGTTSLQGCQL